MSQALDVEHLTKRFGPTTAVDDLSMTVGRGEIFGFLGPNGAGKSTTIRLLLGMLRPDAGNARVMGIPAQDVARAHRHLSYVPGEVVLWPQLTGRETLDLLGNLAGAVDARFREELIARLRLDPDRRVGTYSRGNRQKVALVAAFMTRPDVLLLDEPTAGLDPLMEREFQTLAREAAARGQTIFLSSHLLGEVSALCTRAAILRAGRLVEVADLSALPGLGTTVYEALFVGPPPDLAGLGCVHSVEPIAGGLRITASDPAAPLLARLADAGVTRLHSSEPSLEEVFLGFYRDADLPTEAGPQ